MTPAMIAADAQAYGRPQAGSVLFDRSVYDRRLRRCRLYAVADGEGGTEWRVVKESFEARSDSEVEVCFQSYTDAMRWLA